ncbi:MAG: CHC2 zinc finger domain-containing protein [Thermodesulfobacteriota bacterium]
MNNLTCKITDLNLSGIVQLEGVKLRRSGRYWIGRCPFHADKTPSFTVRENHFRCYGCGAHGDALDFIRALKGFSFKDAATTWALR